MAVDDKTALLGKAQTVRAIIAHRTLGFRYALLLRELPRVGVELCTDALPR